MIIWNILGGIGLCCIGYALGVILTTNKYREVHANKVNNDREV